MISNELKSSMSIHHIVFTVLDAVETETFYTLIFGKPIFSNPYVAVYNVGKTRLIFTQKGEKKSANEKFDPTVIGLEHFAFALNNLEDLREVEKVLVAGSIENSGIHIDKDSGKEKIWLNDPSNIRVEFYL